MNDAIIRSRHAGRFLSLLAIGALLTVSLPATALAAPAPTVTPATGTALSADTTTAVGGSGAWSTITGPTVNGSAGNLGAGTVVFTIAVPSAFEFRPGFGSAALSGGPGCGTLVKDSGPIVDATTVTVSLSGASSGTCSLTYSGLQARPTALGAAPLETSAINTSGSAGVTESAGTLTVVPGAAILQFTQGTIGDIGAGAPLAPQPIVKSEDKFSNARSGDFVTVSIKPGTGKTGATIDCTTNPVSTDGSGFATFAGCNIDAAGTGYRLLATAPGGTSGESNLFNVTAGAASKLFFFAQPSRGIPGGAFTVQPAVEIQDIVGNRVTTDSTTDVTLALTSNPGGGLLTCSGGPTKKAVNGLATFAGCAINVVGVGYRITASSSPALATPTVVSALFDVADRLVFTQQPSAATSAGIAFATQPVVAVRAGTTNTSVNNAATVVTLSIKAGTGATGATLTCDSGTSRTVVAGVATFAGCRIDKISPASPANPYKIVASASQLTSAESNNVTITAGAASKLGFTAQPNAGSAAQPFPIQPVVAVQDAGGNTVTSGTNSTVTVVLTLGAGAPVGSSLTCTGGLSKAAVAGVATFTGCSVNAAGTYTLVATALNPAPSTSLTAGTSSSFVVGALPASITLTNSASVITWGQGVTLRIQFGTGGANRTFTIERTRDSFTWFTEATLTTNASGFASYVYRPAVNHYFRIRFAGAADLSAGLSNTTRTVVRQIALLRPTNGGLIKSIARNTSVTFTTTVRPARPELPKAVVSFRFYRLSGGTWTLVTTRDVVIDSLGKAATTFKFTSGGSWYVRSIANPIPSYNANSVWSPLERYNVR